MQSFHLFQTNKNILTVFLLSLFFITISFQPVLSQQLTKKTKTISNTSFDVGINEQITFFMKIGHLPSVAACLINDDNVVAYQCYGYYDLQEKKVPTKDTIYMAGSITKTVVATAFLQLWEQDYFDLDDDVNSYLPFSLRNPIYPDEPITFRMLLSHQSSLSELLNLQYYFFFTNYSVDLLEEYLVPGGKIYSDRIWSDRRPGEGFEYANIGYEILGYIFEQMTHQSIEQYCEEHIFQPLGMNNTHFHVYDYSNHEHLAISYAWRLFYVPFPQYDIGVTAAGGIRTTLSDLSTYFIAHMNQGTNGEVSILQPNTTALMHSIQFPENNSGNSFQYGLGWMIDTSGKKPFEGHTGGVFGSGSIMIYQPSEKTGIILFFNQRKALRLRPYLLEMFALSQIQSLLFNQLNIY